MLLLADRMGMPHPKKSHVSKCTANRRSGESGFKSNPIVAVVNVAR